MVYDKNGKVINSSKKAIKSSNEIISNKEPADMDMAYQLEGYIESNGQLYTQMIVPVIKNLERKVKKGIYDYDKSLIMWEHVADEGAKRYVEELGGPAYNVATRKEVAKKLSEYYEENYMGDNPIESSKKPIKSDFNPYYEKHPDTFVAYLVGDKDSVTQEDIDKAEREWYKLMYIGYGSLYGETGHLFLGPYENVKSYVEDYLGVGLLDDYLYTYDEDDSVLDHFETQPDKPLPTEKDYQDFVNQLNKYVAENYETHGNYGPIYVFDMYKGEGTNSDGYGHEYPNFIIYDDEGNLNMHSDDNITEYIRNELEAKGWYPEAVHSSSDFTIAVI